jgi:hypothetical protein
MNSPNFFVRFFYAFVIFFRVIFDRRFAGYILDGWQQDKLPPRDVTPRQPELTPRPQEPVFITKIAERQPTNASALQLLGILQREGRFVDFLQEDIASYDDSTVGAAVRIVHEGCRKALSEYITLEPIRTEPEGASVQVDRDFDRAAIRLTGNVTGEPPFTGALRHHGWRAADVRLPQPPPNNEAAIVAPAEVEL